MIFQDLQFLPNFTTGHVIHWQLDAAFNVTGPYLYVLQLAETSDFSELLFSTQGQDVCFLVDDSKKAITQDNTFYYRVKLTAGSKDYFSPTISFGSKTPDRRKFVTASDIVRKELLRISKYVKTEGWLLRRKTYGEKATAAVDFVSGAPIADNVGDFGTGIVGGYHQPLGIMYSVEGHENSKNADDGYNIHADNIRQIRMVGFPMLEDRDIITDNSDGSRWGVMGHRKVRFPGTSIVLIQRVTVKKIPLSDTVYKFTLPEEYGSIYC